MMKKNAYIKLLGLMFLGSVAMCIIPVKAQWVKLTSGSTESLTAAYFINRDTGYVVGVNGQILTTHDGGTKWNKLSSGTTKRLNDVYFTSSGNGFVAAADGLLLFTTNGGITWESRQLDSTRNINAVVFVNSLIGFAVGDSQLLIKTTDGGNTWVDIADTLPNGGLCANLNFKTLYFLNETSGYVGGGDGIGTLLKTNNGGVTWNTFDNNPCYENEILKLSCVSEQKCFAIGFYSRINQVPEYRLIRFDADSAIVLSNSIYYDYYSDVYITSQGIGYLAGKVMYKTTDFFEYVWTLDTTYSELTDLFFVDNEVGYAVGNGGTIIKITNAGLGYENKELDTKISTLYPNPATRNILVAFSIENYEQVSCTFHNMLGLEIITFINGFYYPGNYTIEFDVTAFKPGIYFCTLKTARYLETQKLVKIE